MTVEGRLTEFHSSELSRNPAVVFAAAHNAPVRITRRDAQNLVLMSEETFLAQRQLFDFAATFPAITADDHGTRLERMLAQFPWMLHLSPADQQSCAEDLIAAVRGSLATQEPFLIVTRLRSWKETALALADGLRPSKPDSSTK